MSKRKKPMTLDDLPPLEDLLIGTDRNHHYSYKKYDVVKDENSISGIKMLTKFLSWFFGTLIIVGGTLVLIFLSIGKFGVANTFWTTIIIISLIISLLAFYLYEK